MKIDNKLTLASGEEVKVGDTVVLTNDRVFLVQSFSFDVAVRHYHASSEYDVLSVSVQGINTCSGDFAVHDKNKIAFVIKK